MGHTTDFIGHIDIEPGLNEAEQAFLSAFHHTRHVERTEGPYYVAGNPYAQAAVDSERVNQLGAEKPGLWCRWLPCRDGCCLSLDGEEEIYDPVRWLDYLINHFLREGAEASKSGLAAFDGFAFDHRLEGLVVGCRRDDKELFAIRVSNNVITEEVLRPADRQYLDYPPLPYEAVNDRDRERTKGRKSSGRGLRSL